MTSELKIRIFSRRRNIENVKKDNNNIVIIDVTSKSKPPWVKFSPFFPHGTIPVPFSPGVFSESVEGIWQGLKVFETIGIDQAKFHIRTMKGIKRTTRKFGAVLGHQKGVSSTDLLPYIKARREIYLPSYKFILDHYLKQEIDQILNLCKHTQNEMILLDYETNCVLDDPSRPLSHAWLIKSYLRDEWPC